MEIYFALIMYHTLLIFTELHTILHKAMLKSNVLFFVNVRLKIMFNVTN